MIQIVFRLFSLSKPCFSLQAAEMGIMDVTFFMNSPLYRTNGYKTIRDTIVKYFTNNLNDE